MAARAPGVDKEDEEVEQHEDGDEEHMMKNSELFAETEVL
jgi:hypothetical protein